MTFLISRGFLVMISMMIMGAVRPAFADDATHAPTELNGGYYLLHHLSDNEADVPKLMFVKHAPAEIVQFADDVGKVAKKSLEALGRFQDGDASIRFDQNPLPAIEQNVRDSIKADKQHQLLFGTTDSEFVRSFLVSQIEATTYAVHLSKVLAEQETDPARARTLEKLSNDWGVARTRAYRLLRNY